MATHSCPPPAAMMSSTMRLFGCTRASTTSTPWVSFFSFYSSLPIHCDFWHIRGRDYKRFFQLLGSFAWHRSRAVSSSQAIGRNTWTFWHSGTQNSFQQKAGQQPCSPFLMFVCERENREACAFSECSELGVKEWVGIDSSKQKSLDPKGTLCDLRSYRILRSFNVPMYFQHNL